MEWLNNAFAFIFVRLLDTMAYALLAIAYDIFEAVAKLNLFGGGAAGEELYNTITSRFYTMLSVVMIFVFAYQLIMMIIDPDGKEQKASGTLIKDTLVSIIAIILLPTLFRYMALFQNHVISNNTVGAIILGQNGMKENENPGKNISLMVFMSFYHPNYTTYSTFFDEDGELRSDAEERCNEESADDENPDGRTSICEQFVGGLEEWEDKKAVGVGDLTGLEDVRNGVGDSVEYMWFLCTAAGLITSWFFFAYSIAMGTRAVKLGVLQLIAPIPLVFRIFPITRKTYETWFNEIKNTYLEVFVRLGVIFFVVALIQQVPTFIRIIFDTNNDAGSGLTKCIATVCLILGMLQFAKDAPDLFKTLFSNGGNLLSGLNLSPKIRSHIESNPYGMKAIGALSGSGASAVGSFLKRYRESYEAGGGNVTGTSNKIKSAIAGLSAVPRGLISGGRAGYKNAPTKLNKDELINAASSGVRAGQESLDNRGLKNTRENLNNFIGDVLDGNGSQSFGESWENFKTAQKGTISDWAHKTMDDVENKAKDFKNFMYGETRDYTKAATAAETISSSTGALEDLAKVENDKVKARKTAVEEKVNAGETYTHMDGKTYTRMYKDVDELKTKYGENNLREVANTDGTKTIYTNDGTSYSVSADNKVISKTNAALVNSKNRVEQAVANNQTFTSNGKTYANISNDLNTIMTNATVTNTSTGTNGETIKEFTTANNEKYVEYTFADGTKQVETTNGSVKFNISADNVVQSKETITVNASGQTVTSKVENAQILMEDLQQQVQKNTTYNVEQVYEEFTNEENKNFAKAMSNFSDARAVQSATMLQSLKDNKSSFSAQYNADAEEFLKDYKKTIEDFLTDMSNKKKTSITAEEAEQFKRIKKIMGTEVKRSKSNADAEKRQKEAAEAAKPKKDEKKS